MVSEDGGLRGPAVKGVRAEGAATVVELGGELDLHNAGEIRTALEQASASSGPVVVDLGGVEFIDSTVIGVLVEARKRGGASGLRLARAGPSTLRAFRVAGVDTYLPLFASVDAALGA